MNNAQLAGIIKELCKSRGTSVSKMLSECGIRKSLIYDLEKRDWTPSISVAEQIANYFDCSVDYLLGRTDNPTVSGNNISNFDTTINGTQANIIQGAETDLDEIKVALSKLTSSNRHRAIADMLDLLEKYIEK
ncbi:putative uncharacterized protein [Ruminococcus sp. CAG:254]|nr:putative uncharacterized protein [Ruminococcus sp. CAG:254]